MADERDTSSERGNSLGDRLANGNNLADRLAGIIAESANKTGSAKPAAPAACAEWHVIHVGQELGPLPFANLVEKAVAGEIDTDDLVKKTGGLWTKAREVPALQEQFRLRQGNQETLDKSDTRIADLKQCPDKGEERRPQPEISLPKSLRSRFRRYVWGMAAILLIALGLGCLYWWQHKLRAEADPQAEQKRLYLKRLDEIAERLIQRGLIEDVGSPQEKRDKVRQWQAWEDQRRHNEELRNELRDMRMQAEINEIWRRR